jgi:hypothetical protein
MKNDQTIAPQSITSEGTSVNQVPGLFTSAAFGEGTRNLDYGGGRHDKGTEYLKSRGVESHVYDPFNRSREHNQAVLDRFKKDPADTATVANVLNVIPEREHRLAAIYHAAQHVKPGGQLFFSVYEKNKTGVGEKTRAGYQANRPLADYLDEIRAVLPDAERKGNMIVATTKKVIRPKFASGGSVDDAAVNRALLTAARAIKRARGGRAFADMLRSGGAEAARALKQERGTPQQMLAALKGVKKEELEHARVADLIKDQPLVTKDEIAKIFERNTPDIAEKEKKDPYEEKWTLPGGFNSRVLLLKLPEYEGFQDEKQHWKADPNTAAHIRLKDRIGPNGEKILHVEEVQSDWGQVGRQRGFGKGRLTLRPGEIEPAPYVTNTESWTDLALKRVMHEAAKGGYDKVMWTPGDAQAKRYNLSNHIDTLAYLPYQDESGKTKYKLRAGKDGRILTEQSDLDEQGLASHVGKEMAQKIIDGHKTETRDINTVVGGDDRPIGQRKAMTPWNVISGLDLEVGGQWPKKYYGLIVPNSFKRILKDHGGVEFGSTEKMSPRRAYDEAIAPHRRAYNEAVAPHRRAYNEARATHQRALDEALDTHWRAYNETIAPHRRAYNEAIAPYQRALDEANASHRRGYGEPLANASRAYNEAIASQGRAYNEAITPHWRALDEAIALQKRAYDEAIAPHRRAYDEALATNRRAYDEARASQRRAFNEAKARGEDVDDPGFPKLPSFDVTPEMRESILNNGFKTFARGGEVEKSAMNDDSINRALLVAARAARKNNSSLTSVKRAAESKVSSRLFERGGSVDEPTNDGSNATSEPRITTASLQNAFDTAVGNHRLLPPEQQKQNVLNASRAVGKYVGTYKGKPDEAFNLFQQNAKLAKAELSPEEMKVLTDMGYDGAAKFGLALSPDMVKGGFHICAKSTQGCKGSCLAHSSGGNFFLGGGRDVSELKGPRLDQYNRSMAFFDKPDAFAVKAYDEIKKIRDKAKKKNLLPVVRFNATSDIHPRIFSSLIKAFPDVVFDDYTKLNYDPIAPNHHVTYSSSGVMQPRGINGVPVGVWNDESNWKQSRRRLDNGFNISMPFSNKDELPKAVWDQETGRFYRVVDGDSHDYRFVNKQPAGSTGVVVGLKNKDLGSKGPISAITSGGFLTHFDPKTNKDGIVAIAPQDAARRMMEQSLVKTREDVPAGHRWVHADMMTKEAREFLKSFMEKRENPHFKYVPDIEEARAYAAGGAVDRNARMNEEKALMHAYHFPHADEYM